MMGRTEKPGSAEPCAADFVNVKLNKKNKDRTANTERLGYSDAPHTMIPFFLLCVYMYVQNDLS